MKSNDDNEENKDEVWTTVYGYPLKTYPKPKFKVGDHVKVQVKLKTFAKGFEPNFDKELYVVTEVFCGNPNMYSIRDECDGGNIVGRYYEQQLSLVLK